LTVLHTKSYKSALFNSDLFVNKV